MKALSIREPWASLIVDGVKIIEVRYWAPASITRAKKINGQTIGIHAGKNYMGSACGLLLRQGVNVRSEASCHLGFVIGTARLYGIVTYKTTAAFNRDRRLHLNPEMPESDDIAENFFAYKKQEHSPIELIGLVFKDPKRIEAVPVKGRLGFFEVD